MDLGQRAGASTLQNISSYKYHPLFNSPKLVWEAEICCHHVVYKLEGRGSVSVTDGVVLERRKGALFSGIPRQPLMDGYSESF